LTGIVNFLGYPNIKNNAIIMKDSFPGKPKLLFIALAQSTHTHAWAQLLKNQELNVRVFAIDKTQAPDVFQFQTYCYNQYFMRADLAGSVLSAAKRISVKVFLKSLVKRVGFENAVTLLSKYLGSEKTLTLFENHIGLKDLEDRWLAMIVDKWRPDIIHTLGLDPASYTYYRVRNRFKLAGIGKWVVTARGGPEFLLKRMLPGEARKIREVFQSCDQFIADNHESYNYASEMGLESSKVSSLGVVPGTGGVDVDELSTLRREPASASRIIVYPKAYECPASKALPVFEALRLCWEKIRPCKIYMTAVIPETQMWFQTFPERIKSACYLKPRIPRKDLIQLMAKSRIMLAPSLSDGIPNTLYEAMAVGALPIVSPLDTIRSTVQNEKHVLFARNLYPQEISDALARAMTDDNLVDSCANVNFELVRKIANRKSTARKVVEYYKALSWNHRHGS
jgi:glycosyltransferase involved in cell wall biosynthesis